MDEPTPDERFERIPWEHLVPTADPSRRWLWTGVTAVAAVGIVAFVLGSRGQVPPSAVAAPPPSTPTTTTLVTAPVGPLPSEADLRAPGGGTGSAGAETALVAYLAEAFSGQGVWVDQVGVRSLDDGRHVASISLFEARDGGWVRAAPIGVELVARAEAGRVVVESIEPAAVPPVSVASPAGEVADVPDPVRDALLDAVSPWPGATIERVGSDAGRWWAEVALTVGDTVLTTVIWPDLGVGFGAGG